MCECSWVFDFPMISGLSSSSPSLFVQSICESVFILYRTMTRIVRECKCLVWCHAIEKSQTGSIIMIIEYMSLSSVLCDGQQGQRQSFGHTHRVVRCYFSP